MSQNRRQNNPQDMTLREQISQKLEHAKIYMCTNRCKYFQEYEDTLKTANSENYDYKEAAAAKVLNVYCKDCEVRKL